jgi:hypothetical protein
MSMDDEAGLGLAVHWIQQASSLLMRKTALLNLLRMEGNL